MLQSMGSQTVGHNLATEQQQQQQQQQHSSGQVPSSLSTADFDLLIRGRNEKS